MKFVLTILTLVVTLFPTGCHNEQPRPREIVILPDLSASIDKQSRQQMFAAIKDAALHLHRGDSLMIIPITGNAEAELPGRILHYEIPPSEVRRAYDSDMREITKRIEADLSRMSSEVNQHPAPYTDILGSTRVAFAEFQHSALDVTIVMFSDLIQDDGELNFATDKKLSNRDAAQSFAYSMRIKYTQPRPTAVLVERLKSKEFAALPRQRQLAITYFWQTFLTPLRMTFQLRN